MEQTNVVTIRDDDAGVTFTPFIASDGRVGYHCRADNGREAYVYLNPSTGSDDVEHVPNVFVYVGGNNDPAMDEPIVYVDVDGLEDRHPTQTSDIHCCFEGCPDPVTHTAGHDIVYRMCDAHWTQYGEYTH